MAVLVFASAGHSAAQEVFQVSELERDGRTVAVEVADLDGDGLEDLLAIRVSGMPPSESRRLDIYFQKVGADFGAQPGFSLPLPTDTTVFDLANLDEIPGQEFVLLRPRGVRVISFRERNAVPTDIVLKDGVTLGAASNERGLQRVPLVDSRLTGAPVLMLPGLGEIYLLRPNGESLGRLEVGSRAEYYFERGGMLYSEASIRLFLQAPRISVGRIDGDERVDILSATRHELRIFLQREDGSFGPEPQRRLPLELVSEQDHIRGIGTIRIVGRDLNADQRLDLLITVGSGGIMAAKSRTTLHLNRDGDWNLDAPDMLIEKDKSMAVDQLVDLDGDGRLELLQGTVPLSILELVEIFLTRSLDSYVSAYRIPDGVAAVAGPPEILWTRKFGLPLSFEAGGTEGFLPTLRHDFNQDGYLDLLLASNDTTLEVNLGSALPTYFDRRLRQSFKVTGFVDAKDLNADGFPDLIAYDPRVEGAPIVIALNSLASASASAP